MHVCGDAPDDFFHAVVELSFFLQLPHVQACSPPRSRPVCAVVCVLCDTPHKLLHASEFRGLNKHSQGDLYSSTTGTCMQFRVLALLLSDCLLLCSRLAILMWGTSGQSEHTHSRQ